MHVGIAEAVQQRCQTQVGVGEIIVVLGLHGGAFGIDHVEIRAARCSLQVGFYAELAGKLHEEDEMEIIITLRGTIKPLHACKEKRKDVAVVLLAQGVMKGLAKQGGDGGLMGMAGEGGVRGEDTDALQVLQVTRWMVIPLDVEKGEGLEIGGLGSRLGVPDGEGYAAFCLGVEGENIGVVGVVHATEYYSRRGQEHELVDN